VAIISLVLGALCLLFASETSVWPVRLAVLIGMLPGLVAIELLLRAVLSVFSPRREQLEPTAGAQFCCRYAALATTAVTRFAARIAQPFRHRFAPDLGVQLHAPRFLPVLALVAAVGWLLTGIHEIPLQGRGIYERFGKPVQVLALACTPVCRGHWAVY
jgi:hypothetical protein